MKDNKLVFGIVGAGYIGKRHKAIIEAEEETELAAMADVRPREACGIESEIPYYTSLTEMLAAHKEIDVVSICTPNGLHAEMAIEALNADKSVLIEKPMAMIIDEAEAIGEAERQSKGRVFVVFQNRYTPTSVWAKEVVDSGLLGDIRQVVVNCMWNRDERYYTPGSWHGTLAFDGGPLLTQFSHYIDILLWLVGPVKVTGADFADICHQELTDFEDCGVVSFRTKSGGIGTLNYSTAVPQKNLESSITIIGSKGVIKIGGQYMSDVVVCDIDDYEMPQLAPANPPNDYGPYKGSAANHSFVIKNVVDTLLHGAKPTAEWQDGATLIKTISDIYILRTADYACRKPLRYRP